MGRRWRSSVVEGISRSRKEGSRVVRLGDCGFWVGGGRESGRGWKDKEKFYRR